MIMQVAERIYMLSSSGSGKFPSSFCFYIDDEKKALIDTPLDRSFPDLLQGHRVDLIINSHFHRDHTGCNDLFPEAKILAHPLDIPAMESQDEFCRYYGFDHYGNRELRDGLVEWIGYRPCRVDEPIKDGDIINLGKTRLEVIHTPGHSPGHCVFFDRSNSILFSADIDLTSFGPWYGNWTSDVDDMIDSIKKIIRLKPRIILSAHKGLIQNNVMSKLKQYLQRIYENENRILEALQQPTNIDQLTEKKLIYGRWYEPTIMFEYFERLSLIVHLRRLLKRGMVEQIGEDYICPASFNSCE